MISMESDVNLIELISKEFNFRNYSKDILWHVLYRILLEIIYVDILCNIWAYSGFKNTPKPIYYFVSWIVFLFFLPIIRKIRDNSAPSSMMITVLFYVVFIPGTVMIGRYPTDLSFLVLYISYWLILSFAFFRIKRVIIRKPSMRTCQIITAFFAFFFSGIVIFVWVYYAHFRITINVMDVYGIREEASQYNVPSLVAYVLSASRSVIPTLCVYYFARKKYTPSLLLFIIQIINFSIDGLKTALFSLVIAIACYFFYKNEIKRYFVRGLAILGIVSLAEKVFFSTVIIITVFIRRVIFIPSLFNYFYYSFFSINKPDYFKQTFLKYFGAKSIYTKRIPFLIGEFKGNPTEYANNGLFSDAFCNLGFWGIIIMPFMIIIFLKLFDSCARGIQSKLIIGAIVANSMTLISSNLSVFLVSQGFLVTCLVIFFLPNVNKTEYGE